MRIDRAGEGRHKEARGQWAPPAADSNTFRRHADPPPPLPPPFPPPPPHPNPHRKHGPQTKTKFMEGARSLGLIFCLRYTDSSFGL